MEEFKFNPLTYSELCLKEKAPYFEEKPPFNLLIDPKSFLASEMSGIYPEETEFVEALELEDPEFTSIMIDFIGHERDFVRKMNIFNRILMSLIGVPMFKLLPETMLSYSRNIVEEHGQFLRSLENVLKNHSKIYAIEFIETLSHVDSLIESHKKYNFYYSNVENLAVQVSCGENIPIQISSNIDKILERTKNENIYYYHKISDEKVETKNGNVPPRNSMVHSNSQINTTPPQNSMVRANTQIKNINQINFNHSYYNNTFLLNYFKLPIKWQNYTIDLVTSLLKTKTVKSLPDPQLANGLVEFIKSNENLNASLESLPKLIQLSKLFVRESFPIVTIGRRFIKEGKAMKQCRKAASERVLLLFSDIFVYVQSKAGRYLVPRVYRLSYLRVEAHMHPTTTSSLLTLFNSLNVNNHSKKEIGEAKKGKPTIYFYAPRKSFIMIFQSVEERDEWFNVLTHAIEEARSKMIVPKYTEAPLWIPDNVVNRCMQCKTHFSITQRKHHCRGCGSVMCKNCLVYQIIMKNISMSKPVKVCKTCYNRINEERIRREQFKKAHPGQKDEEEIMIYNLNKLVPTMFESSSDTSEEDTNDVAFLLGCP